MAVEGGDVVWKWKGDIKHLQNAGNAARKGVKANMGQITRATGVAMTAAGAAVVGFAGLSVTKYAAVGDEIEKMSGRTGLTVLNLSQMKHAIEQGGGSVNDLEKAAKKMSQTLFEAKDGTIAQVEALAALGLSVEDFKGLSPDEAFTKMTNAVASVPDPLDRAALAAEIFGRAGTNMLPMLAGGVEGMQEARDEADRLGISFNSAADAVEFTDKLDELKKSFMGVMITIAQALLPALNAIMPVITNVIISVKDWVRAHPELTTAIATVGTAVGALMVVLGPLLLMLPGLIAAWPAVAAVAGIAGTALLALTGPVGIVIGIIAALAAAAWYFVDDWGAVWDTIVGVTVGAVDFIVQLFTPVFEVLGAIISMANDVGNAIGEFVGGALFGDGVAAPPQFAAGGTMAHSGMAIVGEQGPEAVFLPGGSQVINNKETVEMMRGGGGGINITLSGDVHIDSPENVRKMSSLLASEINNKLRLSGVPL